jgi:hypothetical protein
MTRTELLALADCLDDPNAMQRTARLKASAILRQIAESKPVAARYGWDGDGWLYIDNGSGSDWLTRHADAEPLYTLTLED